VCEENVERFVAGSLGRSLYFERDMLNSVDKEEE